MIDDEDIHTDEVPPPAPAAVDPSHLPEPEKPFFHGYPVTKWHPVKGRATADDPNGAHTLFQPAHDWFDSPGEADMHRTHRDAQQVIHQNQMVHHSRNEAHALGKDPLPDVGDDAIKGAVRNSVAAQERLDAGNPEPL